MVCLLIAQSLVSIVKACFISSGGSYVAHSVVDDGIASAGPAKCKGRQSFTKHLTIITVHKLSVQLKNPHNISKYNSKNNCFNILFHFSQHFKFLQCCCATRTLHFKETFHSWFALGNKCSLKQSQQLQNLKFHRSALGSGA